jgi:hypothetical protein
MWMRRGKKPKKRGKEKTTHVKIPDSEEQIPSTP